MAQNIDEMTQRSTHVVHGEALIRASLTAPLYLRTLWRYTNAVIIIIMSVFKHECGQMMDTSSKHCDSINNPLSRVTRNDSYIFLSNMIRFSTCIL